jgi:hypothetical protein
MSAVRPLIWKKACDPALVPSKNRREKTPHTGTISAVAVRRRTAHAPPQLGEHTAETFWARRERTADRGAEEE